MNPQTPLSTLSLSPNVISRLLEANFIYIADLSNLKPSELSAAAKLSLKESSEVIRLSSKEPICKAKSILELIEHEDVGHIVTFSESIDELLQGGIPVGAITEISGTPGVGKTQFCMQLCVSVQIPMCVGGIEGSSIYIDTEGSFTISRLKEIASHAESHIQKIQKGVPNLQYSVSSILKNIHYFRCHSYLEVTAVIKNLRNFLSQHSNIRLIAIDSIAFHFRHGFADMAARTSHLCSLTQDLIQQAALHQLAVVVTNQMTMKIEPGENSVLVPALGETWGHCPTLRLYLHWEGGKRKASLMKAPHVAKSSAEFWITAGGIRDVPSNIKECRKRRRSDD